MAVKTEIVKKISVGKLVGKVPAVLPDSKSDKTPVVISRVAGVARGIKAGESTYGAFQALTGDFVCEPMVGENKGKRYRSGVLFLPDVALDLITPHVAGLAKGEGVEVAFAITAKNDDSVTIGYSYGAEFLVEPEGNDPLEALLAKAMPALPAPDAPKDGDKPEGDGQDKPEGGATGKGK